MRLEKIRLPAPIRATQTAHSRHFFLMSAAQMFPSMRMEKPGTWVASQIDNELLRTLASDLFKTLRHLDSLSWTPLPFRTEGVLILHDYI